MKAIIISGMLFILFTSCTKEIQMKEQDIEKRLVLNGLICPDSLISVRVSTTTAILDKQSPPVENATVKLFCDGTFIEKLIYNGKGRYISETSYPIENKYYTIEVELDGYPTIWATDTIPEKTYITYGTHSEGNTYDEYGDPHEDYEIVIDDKEKTNFYELSFIQQYSPDQYMNYYYVSYQTDLSVADPVLRSDSELDYYVLTYIFSDSYFNGTKYKMFNKFLSERVEVKYNQPIVPTEHDLYAILRTSTSVYYNYRKFWLRHSNNQQIGISVEDPLFMSLIGDPIPMYSNVENGYGIFAAYNQTYYKLKEL